MATATASPKPRTFFSLFWRRLRRHKMAMASLVVIVLLILMAIFAPWIAPYDPTAQPTGEDVGAYYFLPPSPEHPLGTDDLGRDVLSRIIYGSRISLLVGFAVALSSVVIGTLMGTLAGYYAGRPLRFYLGPLRREREGFYPWSFALWRVFSWFLYYGVLYLALSIAWALAKDGIQAGSLWSYLGFGLVLALALWAAWFGLKGEIRLDLDVAISRLIDFMLTIPTLPLLLVLSALLRDPEVAVGRWAQGVFGDAASVFIIITILVFFGWLGTARLVRGSILSLREMDYATAAQALGATDFRIMFRHLVPNTMAPLIVQATLQVGQAILVEAALSFLGFGIQPPVATWGNMLTNAQEYIFIAPWLALPPGFMIFITVLAFNYLGDGLRDALDPRSRL
ncbi:Oligopeptide transport system permease protein OppC [Thermus thermophilus]|uniref:Oligopeptide transport system permease protein OppC n=1 Tax=Thermus thermophilus TaxID=274 RepID=A0A3P4ATG8_THETH|nr:ABC transporter permease [Thermus thermophilus]VCU54467.1 Oligopeptide transport system permease protein OppC [Thermus thermophilus]